MRFTQLAQVMPSTGRTSSVIGSVVVDMAGLTDTMGEYLGIVNESPRRAARGPMRC